MNAVAAIGAFTDRRLLYRHCCDPMTPSGWFSDCLLPDAEGAKWTNHLVAKALPHAKRQGSA
jgi:hypothetical protein